MASSQVAYLASHKPEARLAKSSMGQNKNTDITVQSQITMLKVSEYGTEEKIQKPRCSRLRNKEHLCGWAVSRIVNQRLGFVITGSRLEGKRGQYVHANSMIIISRFLKHFQ